MPIPCTFCAFSQLFDPRDRNSSAPPYCWAERPVTGECHFISLSHWVSSPSPAWRARRLETRSADHKFAPLAPEGVCDWAIQEKSKSCVFSRNFLMAARSAGLEMWNGGGLFPGSVVSTSKRKIWCQRFQFRHAMDPTLDQLMTLSALSNRNETTWNWAQELSSVSEEGSISPRFIRNCPVIRIGPIIKFDQVISNVVDSGNFRETRMG